jgi:hypothetical protein
MNHTGVCGTSSPRAARRKAESWSAGSDFEAAGTPFILAGRGGESGAYPE